MTTKDEALRLAQDALFAASPDDPDQWQKAITAIREALAQPAGERGELIRKAMRKAYSLGQTYWQQADSEFTSHHKKADATHTKFITLVEETAALLSSDAQPSEWVGLTPAEAGALWKVGMTPHEYAQAVFNKLREKNAGKLFEDSLFFHEVKNSSNKLAPWLSAALEDPNSCSEFKAAIEWWFQSGITDKKHWPEAGKTVGINGLTHEEESATASVMGLVRKPAAEDKAGGDEPVAWRWPVKKLRGVEWRYSLRKTHQESEPLFTRHQPQAERDKLETLAWTLIDAIEEVRAARTRSEEDWKRLNAADAELRAMLNAGQKKEGEIK